MYISYPLPSLLFLPSLQLLYLPLHPSPLSLSLSVYKPYCMGVFLNVLGLSDSRLSQQLTAAITSYFSTVNNKGISDIRPLSGIYCMYIHECLPQFICMYTHPTKTFITVVYTAHLIVQLHYSIRWMCIIKHVKVIRSRCV